jgi:catechol 2,3-dioxygenase-like lactoylglutathione lyase family enzyme
MVTTRGLTHIHLMVRNLDRALAFYTSVFGLEERFREGRHMVFLGTPGREDLITLNEDPGASAVAGVNGGVDHFGFRLTSEADFDVAIEAVEVAGGRLIKRGEHARGVPFAYVRDPDGYTIELLS